MLRLLHTSDWHLGHHLHDVSRHREHVRFLDWLRSTLAERRVDALLIAGDVFDSANPPTRALALWYEFLAGVTRDLPELEVVVVGGNHDSAARLDAPRPLLDPERIRVLGGLPREGGELSHRDLLVPLHDSSGKTAAWVLAVPYLRTADMPRMDPGEEPGVVAGIRHVYAETLEAARERREPDQALVAMGHLYMTGGEISGLSERKIQVGNVHAVPADVFGEEIAYAALGHLHRKQWVGSGERVRYCGSPLPLSLAEADYGHEVALIEFEGAARTGFEGVPVPRSVDMLRLPEDGPGPLDEVLPELEGLPAFEGSPSPDRPFLEVRVRLERPEPTLRRDIDRALEGRDVRLVKISPSYTGDGRSLGEAGRERRLDQLEAEEVFRRLWARSHEGEPGEELLTAFRELLQDIEEAS